MRGAISSQNNRNLFPASVAATHALPWKKKTMITKKKSGKSGNSLLDDNLPAHPEAYPVLTFLSDREQGILVWTVCPHPKIPNSYLRTCLASVFIVP
jgi:hypothetical protein